MNSKFAQQFFLFHETPSSAGAVAPVRLPVPPGVSFLQLVPGQSPQILDTPPESFADILILEPVFTSRRQWRLAVVNPAAGRLLLNGDLVPRAALLREGDEFSLDAGVTLAVALFLQPPIGPPDPTLIGRPCPVCRVPLAADSRAYHCPCGCGLHAERSEEKSDPLQCWSLGDACPRCQSPIIKTAGFTSLPDFAHA